MAKRVVLDELHLTVTIPNDLSDVQADEIRRALQGRDFMSRLRRTVREIFLACPELATVRVTVSR